MRSGERNHAGDGYRDGTGYMTTEEETRADAITDAALDALAQAPGTLFRECVGCEKLVHHTDLEAHARSCGSLRREVDA